MAVRIPTYERHVQLDSGAQTIPRYTADTSTGKALIAAGNSLMQVAAHWKSKQDSFDHLQLVQNYAVLKQQIHQIQVEEATKFNPGQDPLGTYHERVQQRVAAAVAEFTANAPASKTQEARVFGQREIAESSGVAAQNENSSRNEYGKRQLEQIVGQVNISVQKNPDSIHQGLAQIREHIKRLGPISGFTDAQARILEEGYVNALVKNAAAGFAAQGRQDVGKQVLGQFFQDRRAEDAARVSGRVQGTEPQTPAPAPTTPAPAKPAEKTSQVQEPGGGVFSYKDTGTRPLPADAGTVVASADGSVVSDTRPPQYVGGMNIGGPPVAAGTVIPPEAGAGTVAAPPGQPQTYNQSRIAQIDRIPEVKAAIEKVAAETGLDPNMMKTVASIESSGRTNAKTGSYNGLFQLSRSEFGMHGGGDINNAEDNARAFASMIKPRLAQFEQQTGRPATPTDLYMIHQQGLAGWISHMKDPDQPAWKAMHNTGEGRQKGEGWAKLAIWGNIPNDVKARFGSVENVKSADLYNIYNSKVRGGPIDFAGRPGGGEPAPVQVAGPGAPTGTPPAARPPTGRWDVLEGTINNQLDGSSMKAASIANENKKAFQKAVNTDARTTELNGVGITLPKELQDYYKTPGGEISYDMVEAKLGTAAAEKWKSDKDYAHKIYNGGAHLEDMSRSGMAERLRQITPDDTSPYYDDQVKVFNAVLKKAQKIENDRNADPAGYADKDPVVAQALKDARENPNDESKMQALILARMNRQEHLGIDPALRTPISNYEAKILAQPLLNRARPDRDSAGTEVAQNIVKLIGRDTSSVAGIPNLQQRALETVLKQKGITDQQAAATADALVVAQQPPPGPLTRKDTHGWKPTYTAKDGYYDPVLGIELTPASPSDNYADPPEATGTPKFVAGSRFIPGAHIKKLLEDPSLADVFDKGSNERPGYGEGAAAHFLGGGKNVSVSSPLNTPTPEEQTLMPAPIIPAQPDPMLGTEEANPEGTD